jgi:hypothetical protein
VRASSEIFEHSTFVLFDQLRREVAELASLQALPKMLLLPKVRNVKRLGPSDWRRAWLTEFVRRAQLLSAENRWVPEFVAESLQQNSSSEEASITSAALGVVLTRKSELRVRILDAAVLGGDQPNCG